MIPGETDLASKRPDLAAQLVDPSLATELSYGSNKKVEWRCEKGHEWTASVGNRARGSGCLYCTNRLIMPGFNDLATTRPDLAAEWHPTLNGDLSPSDVMYGSARKVWWLCPHGHEYRASLNARSNRVSGCPRCARVRRTSFQQEAFAFYLMQVANVEEMRDVCGYEVDVYLPDLKVGIEYNGEFWHRNRVREDADKRDALETAGVRLIVVEDNRGENSTCGDVVKMDGYSDSDVEWAVGVVLDMLGLDVDIDIERDGAKIREHLDEVSSLRTLEMRRPDLAAQWDYGRNGFLKPSGVHEFSHMKVWWECEAGHSWQMGIADRTSLGEGCPYCAGKRVMRGVNDLESAFYDVAQDWDWELNGGLTPSDVHCYSRRKVWWRCGRGHVWQVDVASRTGSGCGCPYCSNNRVLVGFNDLATTRPEIAAQWDVERNGETTPADVVQGSGKRFWWRCEEGHVWRTAVRKRAAGQGCPYCKKLKRWTGAPAPVR